jgi:hypothetical protein
MTAMGRPSHLLASSAIFVAMAATISAESPRSGTLAAWDAYVAAVETRIERELRSPDGFLAQDFADPAGGGRAQLRSGAVLVARMDARDRAGRTMEVPSGTNQHWRGSIFVPGVTLDGLLSRLQHPSASDPLQEDVLAVRVLDRHEDQLDLFIRMTRRSIVTVTYDTEHHVTYRRHGPRRASSRSVATKIVEVDHPGTPDERPRTDGDDRGFLWRLNSYWRYEEVTGGVIVELESVTLSRPVPFGLGALVEPLIDRIARESVGRTLENLRRYFAAAAPAGRS